MDAAHYTLVFVCVHNICCENILNFHRSRQLQMYIDFSHSCSHISNNLSRMCQRVTVLVLCVCPAGANLLR